MAVGHKNKLMNVAAGSFRTWGGIRRELRCCGAGQHAGV